MGGSNINGAYPPKAVLDQSRRQESLHMKEKYRQGNHVSMMTKPPKQTVQEYPRLPSAKRKDQSL